MSKPPLGGPWGFLSFTVEVTSLGRASLCITQPSVRHSLGLTAYVHFCKYGTLFPSLPRDDPDSCRPLTSRIRKHQSHAQKTVDLLHRGGETQL
jgi:hypothetical protein